jgi:hypothetical protein
MKTFRSVWLFSAILSVLFFSCKKSLDLEPGNRSLSISTDISSETLSTTGIENLLTQVTYCSAVTVPLCAGQFDNVGTVTVKTGSDNNLYVTYTIVKSSWFITELHLYVGDDGGIPVNNNGNPNPGHFPYSITFSTPYTVQEYTFVIPNVASTSIIAAHALVVKIASGNGNIVDRQTGWGDGCSGTPILPGQGNWGTKFTYNKGNCEPPDICSKAVHYFFDSTLNGENIIWPIVSGTTLLNAGNVTIGGYSYTEDEGRAIYGAIDINGMPDSKNGFTNVATLKLSHTDYSQEANLLIAVNTIETWLSTCGKLSPTHLPTNNSTVKYAADYIHAWIGYHICPDRR